MTEQEQLTKILMLVELTNSRLDQLDRNIKETNQRIEQTNQRIERDVKETNQRIENEVKRWDERFFQLVKEQGQTSRTIIIAAASVVVLSPVLAAFADFVRSFFN